MSQVYLSDFDSTCNFKNLCNDRAKYLKLTQIQDVKHCFNCNGTLPDNPFFTPIKQTMTSFKCGNIPFCRPACMLRSSMDKSHASNEILNIYLKYGADVCPAPPRELLFTNPGLSLTKYHEMCDKKNLVFAETNTVHVVDSVKHVIIRHDTDHETKSSITQKTIRQQNSLGFFPISKTNVKKHKQAIL